MEDQKTKVKYIGSSINLQERISEHIRELNKNVHNNKYLQRIFNKNKNRLCFYVIEFVPDKMNLIPRENYWIKFFDCYKNGMNLCPVAGNTLGYKHSKETKEKMSVIHSGDKNGMYGKNHSIETRKRLSVLKKGIEMSEDFKKKMSLITSGDKNNMYGKNHSLKAKEMIREKMKLRGNNLGKINGMWGKSHSEESKNKMKKTIKESRGGMVGENNGMYNKFKINKNFWPKIVSDIQNKKTTIKEVANYYSVHIATIYSIINKMKNNEIL